MAEVPLGVAGVTLAGVTIAIAGANVIWDVVDDGMNHYQGKKTRTSRVDQIKDDTFRVVTSIVRMRDLKVELRTEMGRIPNRWRTGEERKADLTRDKDFIRANDTLDRYLLRFIKIDKSRAVQLHIIIKAEFTQWTLSDIHRLQVLATDMCSRYENAIVIVKQQNRHPEELKAIEQNDKAMRIHEAGHLEKVQEINRMQPKKEYVGGPPGKEPGNIDRWVSKLRLDRPVNFLKHIGKDKQENVKDLSKGDIESDEELSSQEKFAAKVASEERQIKKHGNTKPRQRDTIAPPDEQYHGWSDTSLPMEGMYIEDPAEPGPTTRGVDPMERQRADAPRPTPRHPCEDTTPSLPDSVSQSWSSQPATLVAPSSVSTMGPHSQSRANAPLKNQDVYEELQGWPESDED